MLEIPDTYFGVNVDSGPKPTYEEKMRVPPGLKPLVPNSGFMQAILCKFKDFSKTSKRLPTVFEDRKLKKNTDIYV